VKLNELKEDYSREEDVEKRAKEYFKRELVANLQKVLAKSNIAQATPPSTTTAAPETPEQKRIRLQKAAQQNIDKTAAPFSKLPVRQPEAPKTPEQIRQERLAAATQAARSGMTDKPVSKPKVWRSNRTDGKSFAMENAQFARLNSLFESILNVDEAETAQAAPPLSIDELIISNFMHLMKAPYAFSPNNTETLPVIQKFAKEIENTYPVDGGKAAIEQLGDWAWDTLSKYKKERNTTRWGASSVTPQQAASQPSTALAPAEVQQSKVGVKQINKLIPTLRKRDLLSVKKNVDNTLAGRGATAPVAPKVKAPEVNNVVKMPKGKVRAAREGGVTPEEQAKFDEKVRQAMASQK